MAHCSWKGYVGKQGALRQQERVTIKNAPFVLKKNLNI